ncbi:hypothetical protein [Xylanibacter brevis]|uniref:hypothetical protein n=1 Tax=Xylanibacter brevis TaxID=83231 RepID=UPI0004802A51|nr:hypothetical protein [Xylanibacter brevis]
MNVYLKMFFDAEQTEKYEMISCFRIIFSEFFNSRNYSPCLEEININLITLPECKKQKRPIYYDNVQRLYKGMPYTLYHLLMIDVKLPDNFANTNDSEAVKMIGDTMVKYFTEVNLPVKIRKSFDKERFVADLKTFFDGYLES